MLLNKKKRKAAAQREKVMELQIQREMVKKNIRLLRSEMQSLVEQAAAADDLDRKILALEYEGKKAQLDTETAHFNELSKLISQINSVAMLFERQKILDQVAAVADGIDTQGVLQAGDELTARRAMLQEDSDALDDVLKGSSIQAETLGESAEFTRLVRNVKLNQVAERREEAAASPVTAQRACG